MRLVRERYGTRAATVALSALVIANVGTICAEFAGVAAGMEVLAGHQPLPDAFRLPPSLSSVLVLRGSFHRVEHVLLALSAIFVAYIFSGFLALPTGARRPRGLVVPSLPSHAPRHPRGRRHARHDAGAVGPGVHPVLRRRQAPEGQGPRLRARRRRHRRGPDRRHRRSSSSSPAPRRCTSAASHPRRRRRGASRSSRSRAAPRRRSSGSGSSVPRCSPPRSCRSRPPTRSRRPSSNAATSTTASARRRSSTGPTA